MNDNKALFVGIDGGATTSKIAAVRGDASVVSFDLLQRPTNSEQGPHGVITTWSSAISEFLDLHNLPWSNVRGVGLAVPGPRRSYGVLDLSPNLPESFGGWDVQSDLSQALREAAGRDIPLVLGNDGNLGGVAEAERVRSQGVKGAVVLLAPGSGLGGAYVNADGRPLDGDNLAGMEIGHLPAPLHLLDTKPFPCGCGRTWGCFEVYTSLAGLPRLLDEKLRQYPSHELAVSNLSPRERALALRGLAQKDDPLALELFDFQARALGTLVATLAMAVDPHTFVIGGGLMDPDATSDSFRDRYLQTVRKTALEFVWPTQRDTLRITPAALGELSQAIGAALYALFETRSQLTGPRFP